MLSSRPLETIGLWCAKFEASVDVFPGDPCAGVDDPTVWTLDARGELIGWHLTFGDRMQCQARDCITRRLSFHAKWDTVLDAIPYMTRFVISCGHGLKLTHDTTKTSTRTTYLPHSSKCLSAALTPDGRYVVGGRRDGSVSVWAYDTGALLHTFPEQHGDWVTAIAIRRASAAHRTVCPAAEYVAVTAAWDGGVKLWALPAIPIPAPPDTDGSSEDDDEDEEDDDVPCPPVETPAVCLHTHQVDCSVANIAFSSDCATIALCGDNRLRALSVAVDTLRITGETKSTRLVGWNYNEKRAAAFAHLAFSPDDRHVLFLAGGTIGFADSITMALDNDHSERQRTTCAFGSDGGFYVGRSDGFVYCHEGSK